MDLLTKARTYAEQPSDLDAMAAFIEALQQEQSVAIIRSVLPLDHERIAGIALMRLSELLPNDVDLLLSICLWKYGFGLDEDAAKYLEIAKRVSPTDLRVLQVEVFLSYGNAPECMLSLCRSALAIYPNDKWLFRVKETLEKTGQLTDMRSPPLELYWQKAGDRSHTKR